MSDANAQTIFYTKNRVISFVFMSCYNNNKILTDVSAINNYLYVLRSTVLKK